MPALDWEGRAEVEGSHLRVPYRLVHCERGLSAGDDGADNLLVEGDNLAVLKSLLPYYRGRVKCVYIDPPYNTGNEGWIYSDRVESPTMRKWLHKVVGDEASDMNRHDKWLCMMYPRLRLLREFLRMDGVIFVSIDDNEVHHLRGLMDEVFGSSNRLASFVWHRKKVVQNDARFASVNHEYVVCYRKSDSFERFNLLPRREAADSRYKNPDGDSRGSWQSVALQAKSGDARMVYSVEFPNGVKWTPPPGTFPKFSERKILDLYRENRLWFGKKGTAVPRLKKYLAEVKQGMVSSTVLDSSDVGSTQTATETLKAIMGGENPFPSPKPPGLIKRIVSLVAGKDDWVLDSFAGSGTTGHAVLQLNKEDGGKRRFVLVEMEKEICRNVAAVRLSRAAAGGETGGGKPIAALGGGFRYCKLGRELFDEYRQIARGVKFSDLAAHVFFSETGVPIPKRADGKTPFLGATADKAVYLLFNGVLGDKTPAGGNVLNPLTLRTLPTAAKGVARIVYGESCELTKARRKRANIVFRKIPREVKSE